MNLNKAFVLGNVTRDPETRALPNGQAVANFSIATNRFYTNKNGEKKQQTEFHNIVAFGKLAETSDRYLTKGSLALIEGRLQTRSWQDNSGNKHYRTEIIAERLQLGPRLGTQRAQETQTNSQKINPPISETEIPIIEEEGGEEEKKEINVEDIPF